MTESARHLYSLEAEQAVIGGAIVGGEPYVEAVGDLDGAAFFDPVHGLLWGEIDRRRKASAAFDLVAIAPWWRQQPAAQDLNGMAYLMTLCEAAAKMRAVMADYAGLVRQFAMRRRTVEAIKTLHRAVHDVSVHPLDAVDAFRAALEREDAPASGVSLREAWGRVERSLDAPLQPKARFGLLALDRRMGGLFAPDLIILGGRPAMGKTSLALNIAVNAAASGAAVHFQSMEMGADQIAGRAASRLSNSFDHRDLRIPNRRPSPDRVFSVASRIPETIMIDDAGGLTVGQLEARARATKQRLGKLDLILVDYLQLMRAPTVKDARKTAEITAITQDLKELAKRLHVCVLALSQINRGVEGREDKRPGLSDLRESGSIEQDADSVLFVYREEYYLGDTDELRPGESQEALDKRKSRKAQCAGLMEIIIAKNRHGTTGSEIVRCNLARDMIMDPLHLTGDAA